MIALSFPTVANQLRPAYSLSVVTLLTTGCGSLEKQKAHKRHRSESWRFFVPATSFNGGCVSARASVAGFLLPRSSTPTHSRRPSCGSDDGGSSAKGAAPMNHTPAINPPASHAAAWKARALAALRADSSLSVRLNRYNAAMTRARQIEAGVNHA